MKNTIVSSLTKETIMEDMAKTFEQRREYIVKAKIKDVKETYDKLFEFNGQIVSNITLYSFYIL